MDEELRRNGINPSEGKERERRQLYSFFKTFFSLKTQSIGYDKTITFENSELLAFFYFES